MKANLHPDYHAVVFQDPSADFAFLGRSTVGSDKSIKWEDGNEYPLITLDISSASHPFYTGKQKLVDTAGRVDKFQARAKQAEKLRLEQAKRAARKNSDPETDEIAEELETKTVEAPVETPETATADK